ncbi:CW-type zinc finger domain containing protein [Nitzschia inconspicua]|uniref:CW-type zinc finger domain containing protein n=1 Tax=Nitzschia inconspicua TaxID=303405 RepID=A0A9K3PS07_9STRA|nr:CW-type zinc finger domain containing protein [Nitzschia inconspicua]
MDPTPSGTGGKPLSGSSNAAKISTTASSTAAFPVGGNATSVAMGFSTTPSAGRPAFPGTNSSSTGATSAAHVKSLKKGVRKKRKTPSVDGAGTPSAEQMAALKKAKKLKRKKEEEKAAALAKKKAKKQAKKLPMAATNNLAHLEPPGLTPAQKAVNEQMRKALEEDQYSAHGSIVDTDTDDDDQQYVYKGHAVRLDRNYLSQAARKHNWLGFSATSTKIPSATQDDNGIDDEDDDEAILAPVVTGKQKKSKGSGDKKKRGRNQYSTRTKEDTLSKEASDSGTISREISGTSSADDIPERDEGSIFGQTTGASNATWVECDKCKKWRRLRGVVDERKLPPKWYCSMNKNDPERARCSAPEEEYDAAHTPESAADARTRKHLRVWVRRLQCNEQYESRLPTLTRGKKRAVASSSKEPHEWIRCCNPSCGKWRAVLRIMDAKQNVIERTDNGEWYCVMNTWDEKTASCAAPQENLPAVGCPPWVLQDE